jgi:hypothetical protein
MDFEYQVREIIHRVLKQVEHLETEEATKNALVMPFIKILGYDIFNPTEVVPEFTPDHGLKKGKKVDDALIKYGAPVILFECKSANVNLHKTHFSQLYRYFAVTELASAF